MRPAKTWIISDCHFGHKNILKFRPKFESIEEHNETIMQNIANVVKSHDTLWILGDMFFDEQSLETYGQRLRSMLSEGRVFLCLGNHDTDSVERARNVQRMTELFDGVHALKSKNGVWYSHAPIHPAELRGRINIHGHVHSCAIPDERYFNACCENTDYKPVLLTDVLAGYRGVLFPDLAEETQEPQEPLFRVLSKRTMEELEGEFGITANNELLTTDAHGPDPEEVLVQQYAGVKDSYGHPIYFGSEVQVSNAPTSETRKIRQYVIKNHKDADFVRGLHKGNRGIIVRVLS